MNINWITESKDRVPSKACMDEIKDLLIDSLDDIIEAMATTGKISMFVEIDGWFLHIGIANKYQDQVFVSHYSENEWLDMINKHKKMKAKSYWK